MLFSTCPQLYLLKVDQISKVNRGRKNLQLYLSRRALNEIYKTRNFSANYRCNNILSSDNYDEDDDDDAVDDGIGVGVGVGDYQ